MIAAAASMTALMGGASLVVSSTRARSLMPQLELWGGVLLCAGFVLLGTALARLGV